MRWNFFLTSRGLNSDLGLAPVLHYERRNRHRPALPTRLLPTSGRLSRKTAKIMTRCRNDPAVFTNLAKPFNFRKIRQSKKYNKINNTYHINMLAYRFHWLLGNICQRIPVLLSI
jgi:hypothetical protein